MSRAAVESRTSSQVATGSMHIWNKAEISEITFPRTGWHLLTLRYNKRNNLASFEFILLNKKWRADSA